MADKQDADTLIARYNALSDRIYSTQAYREQALTEFDIFRIRVANLLCNAMCGRRTGIDKLSYIEMAVKSPFDENYERMLTEMKALQLKVDSISRDNAFYKEEADEILEKLEKMGTVTRCGKLGETSGDIIGFTPHEDDASVAGKKRIPEVSETDDVPRKERKEEESA